MLAYLLCYLELIITLFEPFFLKNGKGWLFLETLLHPIDKTVLFPVLSPILVNYLTIS